MRDESLIALVAHMRWADALVGEALRADAAADAQSLRLFAHVAAAEHLWLLRLREHASDPIAVWPALSASEATALAAESAIQYERLAQASEDLLRHAITYRNSAGREFTNTVADVVRHVTAHGSYHRGQIALAMRASGKEPPYTDYIGFVRKG